MMALQYMLATSVLRLTLRLQQASTMINLQVRQLPVMVCLVPLLTHTVYVVLRQYASMA